MPTFDQKQMRADYVVRIARERNFNLPTNFVINAQGARSWKKIKELYRQLGLDWLKDVPENYSRA